MAVAVAPYSTAYISRTPYLTAAEYQTAPTAVDLSALDVTSSSPTAQTAALIRKIAGASSWADRICHQVLAATLDVEQARVRVNRNGVARMPLRFKPILEVDTVSVGLRPSQMTALPASNAADVVIDFHGIVDIPVLGVSYGTGSAPPGQLSVGDEPLVQVSYVNGYPNTVLASGVAAGVSSITVTSALGVYPGTTLTVYDGANTEPVTVASTYTTGTILPLSAPLAFPHAAGISVSALPPAVKEAVICLTSALIKTRGSEAIVMADIGSEPSKQAASEPGGLEDVAVATDLLSDFIRQV